MSPCRLWQAVPLHLCVACWAYSVPALFDARAYLYTPTGPYSAVQVPHSPRRITRTRARISTARKRTAHP